MADYRFPGEHVYKGMVLEEGQIDENVEKVRAAAYVDGDILIASYPKTGTTWMSEVAWLVNKQGDLTQALAEPLYARMLFLEHADKVFDMVPGIDLLKDRPRPTIMKTHLPAGFLDEPIKEGKLKLIVVVRNPKDTLVSLYHFYRLNIGLGNFTGSWDEFFELYKSKHLLYGDYFDWYSSWLPYLDRANVQLVAYEDMKADITSVLKKLSDFLGKPLTDGQMETIITHTSFKSMKANDNTNYANLPNFKNEISPFMRKGQVGDWNNYFSDEQSRIVDEEYTKKLEDKGMILKF